MTFLAKATSSGSGEKTLRAMSSCAGWSDQAPTIFYVGRSGRATAPRVATGKLQRIRAGRYRSEAVVRLPAEWDGRFRYTGGSGMGNPRSTCPRRFRF